MPIWVCKKCKRWYRPSGGFPWGYGGSGLCQICYYKAQKEVTGTIRLADHTIVDKIRNLL